MATSDAASRQPADVSVMISYSRDDSGFVDKLQSDLDKQGFATWVDRRDIPPGKRWDDEIRHAIDAAHVVLVVLSPKAAASTWVRKEHTYARRRGKVIIPLLYLPCDIPAALARARDQAIEFKPNFVNPDAYYAQQFSRLASAIAGYASLDTEIPLPVRERRDRSLLTGTFGLVALVTATFAFLAGYANSALLPAPAQPYALRLSVGAAVLGTLSVLALGYRLMRRPDAGIRLYLADRERFLTKVHTRYTNRLKPPFEGALLLTLGLSEDAQAVARPSLARQEGPGGAPQSLPAGTTISTAFKNAEGQLLILGAPGAGKSWLLYQLALALVERARRDDTIPVPVVFNLASWAQERKSLTDWMVDQLTETWLVPPTIARVWVDRRQVFPLLDGLDEVRKDVRDACVEAINRYQHSHGLLPLAVCCRKADYDALEARLDVRTAVVAEPLTPEQIDTYLAAGGAPLASLRTLARGDEQMRDLLSTPLMLNVVALAYEGKGADAIPKPSEDKKTWTQAVFRDYVPTMLARRLGPNPKSRGKKGAVKYSVDETMRYLAWLAAQMQEHERTDMFYLEQLQPDWLPNEHVRRQWRSTLEWSTLLVGALVGLLAYGLVGGLVGELILVLVGTFAFVMNVRVEDNDAISLVSDVRWRSLSSEDLANGLDAGLGYGLVLGLVGGLFGGLLYGLVGGLFGGLVYGLPISQVDSRDIATPNEGLARSWRTGLVSGLVSGLVIGFVIAMNELSNGLVASLLSGLIGWPVIGLTIGLNFGLFPSIMHLLLQRALARLHLTPPRFIAFLDFATDHVLLQRVGGGYRFVHALLLDYFADQWPALSATDAPKQN